MSFCKVAAIAALSLAASASPLDIRQSNFPATVKFLGNYTPSPNDFTIRDLGFSGKLGSTVINSFGDTLQCTNASMTFCLGPEANSAGIGESPTTFKDTPNTSGPQQFCKFTAAEQNNASMYGLGITNVVPDKSSTVGILYTQLVRRNGTNPSPIGAGAAQITLDSNGAPVCNRLADHWWGPDEPFWGDHSAFQDPAGQFIYNVGGCSPMYNNCKYIFVSRVAVGQATDLTQYRYWNGTAYGAGRIYGFSQYALKDVNGSPITDGGQGQIMWNNHLGKYVYLYNPNPSLNPNMVIRTASKPEGPWSLPSNLFNTQTQGGCSDTSAVYSPTIEPWWYSSDQTIDVVYTCYPNGLRAVQVQFT